MFYALLPAGRGRGTATAVARTLASWARDTGAESIGLLTHLDNEASQRVAAKAGFVREGELVRTVKGAEVTLAIWRFAPWRSCATARALQTHNRDSWDSWERVANRHAVTDR